MGEPWSPAWTPTPHRDSLEKIFPRLGETGTTTIAAVGLLG
ncbi:hypothetical protein ACFYQ5_13205 [Streptomyces sp. NPDC005794]